MLYLFIGASIFGTLLLIVSLIFEKSFNWLCKNPRTCFFCPTVIFTTIMVFGYVGGIIMYFTDFPDSKMLFLSLGIAAFSTVITNIILRVFRKIEDETIIESDLINSDGVVVATIPAGGYGEVEVNVNGSIFTVTASSNDSLNIGNQVVVETIIGPGSVKVSGKDNKGLNS